MAQNLSCAKIKYMLKKNSATLSLCSEQNISCVEFQLLWKPEAAAHWLVFLRKIRVDVYGWESSTALEEEWTWHLLKCWALNLYLRGDKFCDAVLGPPIIFNCMKHREENPSTRTSVWVGKFFSVDNSPEIVDLQIQSKQQSPAFSYSWYSNSWRNGGSKGFWLSSTSLLLVVSGLCFLYCFSWK